MKNVDIRAVNEERLMSKSLAGILLDYYNLSRTVLSLEAFKMLDILGMF
jgi:hypothetical protein